MCFDIKVTVTRIIRRKGSDVMLSIVLRDLFGEQRIAP